MPLDVIIPARPEKEFFDEEKQEFFVIPGTKERKLELEHSLVSLSKWESKWKKPFLSTKNLTTEETLDYIRCMTKTQNVPPEVYKNIPNEVIKQVSDYIADPMTATWFSKEDQKKPNHEVITAELIYYWMIALNIPPQYEKWHLNKLITLIRVCSAKNEPPKKMNKRSIMSRNAALNAARRKQLNSKG